MDIREKVLSALIGYTVVLVRVGCDCDVTGVLVDTSGGYFLRSINGDYVGRFFLKEVHEIKVTSHGAFVRVEDNAQDV
jgi:hypothetical protein